MPVPASIIVITNCTSRKRYSEDSIRFEQLHLSDSLETVANRWIKAINNSSIRYEAHRLYAGRSFSDAKRAAAAVGGSLYVVSAGLGLVDARALVPPYDLTVSDGQASLTPLLTRLGKGPVDWWSALNNELGMQHPIRSIIERHNKALILMALPAGYIRLIAQDLDSLMPQQAKRIRIITSQLGAPLVPLQLRPFVLPYDERLEGSAYAGTRTDFPQRALRHFVEQLHGHLIPLDAARNQVLDAMELLQKPTLPARTKKSDAEILSLLRDNWKQCDGASGRLLRHLRDEALVACEQSRFRCLWKTVQAEWAESD